MQNIFLPDSASDTICAISTPAGRGGIAVLRISGPNAISVVETLWKGKSLSEAKSHSAHFGRLLDGDDVLDEAVATVFRAPASFTGDDVVELSVHGSTYIQKRLLSLLAADSDKCRLAKPGEFTQRAFLAGKLDLAKAEAVGDLIASSSRGAHALAMKQLNGVLSQHIADLRNRLIELASLLELELDFSEEDVEFASRTDLLELSAEIADMLTRLSRTYDSGRAIKEGLPVVLAGIPNAGKSTLLNGLLEDDKAIVSDIPGTTRDIVEDLIDIEGIQIRFVDTAGLREKTADLIELTGINKAKERISQASIIIYIFDAANVDIESQLSVWREIVGSNHEASTIILPVVNKTDVGNLDSIKAFREEVNKSRLNHGNNIAIDELILHSNKNVSDIDTIKEKIGCLAKEFIENSDATEPILTNQRHYIAVNDALDNIKAVMTLLTDGTTPDLIAQPLRGAISSLSEITGEIATPHLLHTIFSRFCIGK